jgi:hypothetical protein
MTWRFLAEDFEWRLNLHGCQGGDLAGRLAAPPSTAASAPRCDASTPDAREHTGTQITARMHKLNVFTDGSCRGNGKPDALAGIGVWFGTKDR